MEIKKLLSDHLLWVCNCYGVLSDKAAIVVDPGSCDDSIVEFLEKNSDKERMILLTHCHFDHIGGANELRRRTDVQIAINTVDAPALWDAEINCSAMFKLNLEPFCADIMLNDGDELNIGDITVKVLHTPGHTPGSVSYLIGNNLLCGDTLFAGTYGRTDFIGGDANDMKNSLKRLAQLSPDTVVYPGHGKSTTISQEIKTNPAMR